VKPLKDYLFWIVCGVLFLVGLVLLFVVAPSNDKGDGVEQVTLTLNNEYKSLDDLDRRAKGGNPMGSFNPENAEDAQRLTNTYLLTPKWTEVLTPRAKEYKNQFEAIQKELKERSESLHRDIATAGATDNDWYDTYQGLTVEKLKKLVAASAIDLAAAQNAGFGGFGGASANSAESTSERNRGPNLEEDAKIRSLVGFYTRDPVKMTTAKEHPLLVTRYRIMERIIDTLLVSKNQVQPNPVVNPVITPAYQGDEQVAQLAGVEWKTSPPPLTSDVGQYASSVELTVNLQGSTAALMAALAAIESIPSPIMVVVGSTLEKRKAPFQSGERKGLVTDPQSLRLTIVVLDFTKPSGKETP